MSLLNSKEVVKEFQEMEQKVKNSFAAIREEMEDHLEAINENTNELQSTYEYICELDNKMDKLNEKIEQLSLTIKQLAMTQNIQNKRYFLTYDEQKVFVLLYALGEQKGPLSLSDIAIRMNGTELLVKTCIKNMLLKNVPIEQKEIDNENYFLINSEFKELQAKENVLNLDESLIREISK